MLGHKSQVGKDTLASFMTDYTRIAFADTIKNLANMVFGISFEDMFNQEKKNTVLPKFGRTPREILIKIGKDMRDIHPDVWCDFAFRQSIDPAKSGKYVVTDFRFKNEYNQALKFAHQHKDIADIEIIPIKIVRKNHNVEFSGKNDISEIDLDDFNMWQSVIFNDGEPKCMYDKFIKTKNACLSKEACFWF